MALVKEGKAVSLTHMAKITGISISMLSRIVGGTREPSVRTLVTMASYLGVSLDDTLQQIKEGGKLTAAEGGKIGDQVKAG